MNNTYPLKKWMVDVFTERENYPWGSNTKMPFFIMSSGARVIKDSPSVNQQEILEKIGKIAKGEIGSSADYNGCVITNQISHEINYQSDKSFVGYDFNGKKITTLNETGRLISQPIIESLNINTDGTGNTMKIANVHIRLFSIKQLEMFELFFCKGVTPIMIEFGDNLMGNGLITSGIIENKNDYAAFVKRWIEYSNPSIPSFQAYLKKCKDAKGSYDRMVGRVSAYSYKIESDGTYIAQLQVTQGNEINYMLPKSFNAQQYTPPAMPTTPKPTKFQEICYTISNPSVGLQGIELDYLLKLNPAEWEKEFFNWYKTGDASLKRTASATPYISLKFVLEVLLNNVVAFGGTDPSFTFYSPNGNPKGPKFFKIDDNTSETIIPITIHKYRVAYDEDVLFPNEELPNFSIDTKGKIVGDTKKTIDARINGKSVIEKRKIKFIEPNGNEVPLEASGDNRIGNALNIFISYNAIKTAWYSSYSRIDFIANILELINDKSFGQYKLIYANLMTDTRATIMDAKLYIKSEHIKEILEDREDYRFKPLSVNSIVRDFAFDFDNTDYIAAMSLWNYNAFLAAKKYDVKTYQLTSQDRVSLYTSMANHTTSEGYYVLDQIMYENLTIPTDSKDKDNQKESGSKKEDNFNKASIKDLIKFVLPKYTEPQTMVVKNAEWIYSFMGLATEEYTLKKQQVPTNIKVTLKIDGISGFNCGELIQVDGVSELYNELGRFRIQNIIHDINVTDGWVTTIDAYWQWV